MKNDWSSLMAVIEIMFNMGYTVSMINHKRWVVHENDNINYNHLPFYHNELRGRKSDLTNLECLHNIITEFVEWSKDNIKPYNNWLTDEEIYFKKQIQPYLK